MKVLVAYIAVTGGSRTNEFLFRFFSTLHQHPPGADFRGVVVANGGPLSAEDGVWVPENWTIYPRANEGADIGGYIDIALNMECDALLACGESVYFTKLGWLKRAMDVYLQYGPGFYGFFASNLCGTHLTTSCFLCDPKLLKSIPIPKNRQERMNFEHNQFPFWRRVKALGRTVKLITWDEILDPSQWRTTRNGLWQGDQSGLLMRCIHSDRYDNASQEVKSRWRRNADFGLRP